jgi:hypothetical protein
MLESEIENNDAVLDDEQENEVKTYEVQWSMKWVNFATEVQAKDEDEAIEVALKSYKENGLEEFTATAKGEEVGSLEEIFDAIDFPPETNCTD